MSNHTKDVASRRNVLRGLVAGVAVVGLGGVSGVGAASDGEGAEIVDGERIPDDEAQHYYERAMEDGGVQDLVAETAGDRLEPQHDEVVGHEFVTDNEELNERDPIHVEVPLAGDGGGRCALLLFEGGEETTGTGQAVVLEDGQYTGEIYALEQGEVRLEAVPGFEVDEGDHPPSDLIRDQFVDEPIGDVDTNWALPDHPDSERARICFTIYGIEICIEIGTPAA